ncbi:MAG: class I SAM-dependent methyltransferase [Candidatus Woesearchaeota archaeon]
MSKVNLRNYAGTSEASPYDELAKHNREYQRLLSVYRDLISLYARNAKIVGDIGCGTGNFTLEIYEALKHNDGLKIYASDYSEDMLAITKKKVQTKSLEQIIRLEQADCTDINTYPEGFFDLINITHVLNYTGKPEKVIRNIYHWLKPGGVMIAVDIGRELKVENWSKQIFKWTYEDFKKSGYGVFAILPTVYHFIKYRAAKRENENFHKGQLSGRYPMHASEEFKRWVMYAGFNILYFSNDFYRDPKTGEGIDDLVVAQK